MTQKEIIAHVAKLEGKKSAVKIGNIREIYAILVKLEKSSGGAVSANIQACAARKKK